MLKTPFSQADSARSFFILHKPFLAGNGTASFPAIRRRQSFHKKHKNCSVRSTSSNIQAVLNTTEKSIKVKAIVTVGWFMNSDNSDKFFLLELVSAHLDPKTGQEKARIKDSVISFGREEEKEEEVKYECRFVIPPDFGDVGAISVENEHFKEMFFKNIVFERFPNGPVNITFNSWVQPKSINSEKRIFFTNKSYLPLDTPDGLKRLREKELEILRGTGVEERKTCERIYDYDKYNDLGDPDSSEELARPVLGGKEHPYPRRCRTGRKPTVKDPLSEKKGDNEDPLSEKKGDNEDPLAKKKSSGVYVPRDEEFSKVKQQTFTANTVLSFLHALQPSIIESALGIIDNKTFPSFTAIDSLFPEEHSLDTPKEGFVQSILQWIREFIKGLLQSILHWDWIWKLIKVGRDYFFRFKTPKMIKRDRFSWFRDDEFSRQTLAGLNPCSIQLVTEWPLKSKLDPEIYGPAESVITRELIEQEIKGIMTLDEAIERKKLFILDYHDLFLPYVHKVREIKGTTLYGSRTLFFLTHDCTLRPLAIELTRPSMGDKPQWKQVFMPHQDATTYWLWKLAKAHVKAHDSGYHQLVIHWLRTHCSVEPYIIAANRQLSAMHPIYRLLFPHFRYTMKINSLARQGLINAGGVIESSFSPGKYSMEICSAAYDQLWRFDMEALPADLLRRGLAVEDPTAKHGLKLTIEDYPFANDGLDLWAIIKEWVSGYVNHYYPEAKASLIESDQELQAWWTEVRTKGHEDKKDEPWWPVLNTQDDLIQILTTIIWVVSGHHAAVNFGQYVYAGYFPNRPTIARTNMPTEDQTETEFMNFLNNPEIALLKCFPSEKQAIKVMVVLDVLSNHSPDEKYIGDAMEPSWAANPIIKAAFDRFSGKLKEFEGIINSRNADKNLKNRFGVGIVPYELLKPTSEPGVTGMGVPNSISI